MSGDTLTPGDSNGFNMFGLRKLLGLNSDNDRFDRYDEYVSATVPEPGWFLSGQDVLTDAEHIQFHQTTRDLFEEVKLYDVSFDYNLARLNLDDRHPNAGFRYAVETESDGVLRAEFTPKTQFCPQTLTITKASFRALNGLSDQHEYDLVRIRVDQMHYKAGGINKILRQQEEAYFQSECAGRSVVAGSTAESASTTQTEERTRSEPPF